MTPTHVLDFWFSELKPEQWWTRDDALDTLIHQRFGELHAQAAQSELDGWRSNALGRLAEIIVLDQFSRNLFRHSAQAFACDAQALVLAQEAIAQGALKQLNSTQSVFLCMPFMHSESKVIHQRAVPLFTRIGLQGNLDFELQHKAIIDRFGRYPHRNALLGRVSTPAELEFLQQPGSAF
jgi:uncharacterized protein (DUF924 family)